MGRKYYFMSPKVRNRGIDPDRDVNVTTEGVASSGAESKLGTVTHRERWDGTTDAEVKPGPVSVKFMTTKKEQ